MAEETEKPAKVKKEEPKVVKTVVATQIPTQEVRGFVGDDGVNYNVVTIDEALTELIDIARQLKKGLL